MVLFMLTQRGVSDTISYSALNTDRETECVRKQASEAEWNIRL